MSLAQKKALSNLSNLVGNNNKPPQKRTLESPNNIANLKKKNAKKNQENICVGKNVKGKAVDPTRTIESKIKKIAIKDEIKDEMEDSIVFLATKTRRPVLARAAKTLATESSLTIEKAPSVTWKECYIAPAHLPANVPDYDRTQLNNIESEPLYAYEIFEYYKQKELATKTEKYMSKQNNLTDKMRAVLVDWMVEVQQNFELNHETLYLAVKFVDHYLMKESITRARFQLLGLTAVFVACKLDERIFPTIDDFIYISDDAYTREDFIAMEIELLKVLDFNLNFPLSYSFLRRFARCASQSIETLTLARYILESSLLDYSVVDELDSKKAAASLLLALKMKNLKWNDSLVFYSGYSECDLESLVVILNRLISTPSKYENIRNKYSDKVFFEVAKLKPISI
ncbi:PREDICTED: G2/mitotic-specific cyclin-B3-like [Rhagoletis zephyria]|uniref:G2/mitotic-specific cyclin-B3-like n=1 Tax=Rhagoletis zephyria TaxID=28612 RepID=UPI0008117CDE|nr:PREDICTED: G2/mitotic-specific cyclin-B3-like [Rhagoletis zephyria]KAH9388616.1 Protein kinase binding [Tyrophagus putrescentiae]